MSDVLSHEQRSKCMSHIRSRNTKPEVELRHELWRRGFRYRINVKSLPGKPDIVLNKYQTVIFVNGCFWHGHDGCKYYVVPDTNRAFWVEKINANKDRDSRQVAQLKLSGWNVIIVWECELNRKNFIGTVNNLVLDLVSHEKQIGHRESSL